MTGRARHRPPDSGQPQVHPRVNAYVLMLGLLLLVVVLALISTFSGH